MKTMYTLVLLANFAMLIESCSRQLAPVGHYQDTKINADGNTDDWGLLLRFSNAEHTFQYSISNDKKNIYICIISDDQGMQMRILRSGMSIYFDPKGQKNKNIVLEFPVKKPEDNTGNDGNPVTASSAKMKLDQLLLQSDYFNTVGFANIENGQFNIGDKKSKIQVAIKLQGDSMLVYEAIIPVNDIPGIDAGATNTSKNFSVGIGVSASRIRANNNYNNSPRPSFGMRGMRMGMGRGGSSARNQAPKEETEWYQFRLAFTKSNN